MILAIDSQMLNRVFCDCGTVHSEHVYITISTLTEGHKALKKLGYKVQEEHIVKGKIKILINGKEYTLNCHGNMIWLRKNQDNIEAFQEVFNAIMERSPRETYRPYYDHMGRCRGTIRGNVRELPVKEVA